MSMMMSWFLGMIWPSQTGSRVIDVGLVLDGLGLAKFRLGLLQFLKHKPKYCL